MFRFVLKLTLGISILIVNLTEGCPKHFICGFLIYAFENMCFLLHFTFLHVIFMFQKDYELGALALLAWRHAKQDHLDLNKLY